MDVQAILDLMKEMKSSGIETLEWSADGQSLRLARPQPAAAASAAAAATGSAAAGAPAGGEAADAAASAPERPQGRLITSPVVGIFYAAPAPDQDPYVTPGATVEAGAPLAIIEAMKLMNEVTSPCSGTVLEILAENGQRVEYGQPLFVIKEYGR